MCFVPMFGVLYGCTRSGAFVCGGEERNHEDNWKIMNVEINHENKIESKYSEHSELICCTN